MSDFVQNNPNHKGRLATAWVNYKWNPEQWAKVESDDNGISTWTFDVEGETHPSMYYLAFYHGLKKLFFDYAYKHDAIQSFKEVEGRFKKMTLEYGYEVKPPKAAIGDGALEHLAAANVKEARLFVNKLKTEYGTETVFRDNVKEWLEALESDPPKQSRADYLAQADATKKELSVFLGNWSDGKKYSIEIKINGSKASGYFKQIMPDGGVMSMKLAKFVAFEDGSIEVAYNNGMLPRSMMTVFRLSPPNQKSTQVAMRLLVYWPTMKGMLPNEKFVLKKTG